MLRCATASFLFFLSCCLFVCFILLNYLWNLETCDEQVMVMVLGCVMVSLMPRPRLLTHLGSWDRIRDVP